MSETDKIGVGNVPPVSADLKDTEKPKAPDTSAPAASDSPREEEESVTLSGIAVFPGVALGQAQILSEGDLDIPHFSIEKTQTRSENLRLRAAVNTVDKELADVEESLSQNEDTPPEAFAFINLQRQILADESLINDTLAILKERLVNAEWALSLRMEELRRTFEAIDNDYLAERIDDISQVVERVQRVLSGRRRPADTVKLPTSEDKVILIAEDLDPADILILKRRRDLSLAGLVTSSGSTTSHAAILARSLEIPTLVSVEGAMSRIASDDVVLLDADRGTLTLHPNPALMPQVSQRIRELSAVRNRQRKLISCPCVTADNVPVSLQANIALPEDVRDAQRLGADGIGLFRSEFLFMNRPTPPSEDEQFEAYRRVIRAMKGKPVTIRTMDLGGDKVLSAEAMEALNFPTEELLPNPALGRRAIRFSLNHPGFFLTQLKAVLRAAEGSNVRLMLPLLTRPSEIEITRGLIRRAQEELRDRNIAHAAAVPLGGMVEVPAAAIALPAFLSNLDFISLGTNDLIQYTLAVDRHDPGVSELYDPLHPAVLTLLHQVIRMAVKAKKPVGVCGEIAGDPTMAKLLIGMGARHLSMESARILPLKEMILGMKCADAEVLVRKINRMHNFGNIRRLVTGSDPTISYSNQKSAYPAANEKGTDDGNTAHA